MEGTSNDKTIGRTNRSSPSRAARPAVVESLPKDTSANHNSPVSAAAAAAGEAPPKPTTVEQPLVYTTTVGSKGGPFEWPTNADHYQLINRIGQGAFASVWRARIRRRIKNDGENNVGTESSKKPVEIHCAIKIMDLEHVNINISGEYENCISILQIKSYWRIALMQSLYVLSCISLSLS